MTTCRHEKDLIRLIHEMSSTDEENRIKDHLASCETCRIKFQELKEIHSDLMERQRPRPSEAFIKSYRRKLMRKFLPETRAARMKRRLRLAVNALFYARPLSVRIAKTAAILLVGILIGRIVFHPAPKPEHPAFMLLPVTPSDVKLMTDFLTESEIWLLAVVNIPSAEELNTSDLRFNREIARKLLTKTSFMEVKETQLKSEPLAKFLNRLEILLLEIANTGDDRIVDVSGRIKQTIQSTTLLYDTRLLREMIETAD